MPSLSPLLVPSTVLAFFGPGLAAFVLALLGVWVGRRNEGMAPVVFAGAMLVGFALLVPTPRAWVMPRVLVEHLVMPAVAGVAGGCAGLWVWGRLRNWALVGALGFSAWWLAGAGAARGEFWRVWFAAVGVAWLLRLLGGRGPVGAVVAGLVLLGGGVLAGVPLVWSGVAGVLLGAAGGVAVFRPGAVLGTGVIAVAVTGTALATGGLMRGQVLAMDLVCAGAVLAPGVVPLVERWSGRRFGRFGRVAAVSGTVAAACGLAFGMAWLANGRR